MEASLVWFPVVGLLLGGVLALVDAGLRWLGMAPLVSSTLLVVLLLVLTGALHADGLVDTCDAVFCHATPERRLEIMRDPHAGAFGVAGLLAVMLLKVTAIDALPVAIRSGGLMLAPLLGRWTIVLLAVSFPYARTVGLGAPLKVAATPRNLVVATVLPAVACVVFWPWGIALGGVAAVVGWLLGRWLMRLLPGLTGDCYGAACEVVETCVLLAATTLAA
jgi:adenosylcobinamide-GDP ribazoletransferase